MLNSDPKWVHSTHTASFKTIPTGRSNIEFRRFLSIRAANIPAYRKVILEKIGITREKKDLPFIMANGQQITRSVGFAIVRVGESFTTDEVVFAEKGDLLLLGARTLEGLNLAAGPIPAASTTSNSN